MPVRKTVRFAYNNTYHSAPPPSRLPPGLSFSLSSSPSSSIGLITPPNVPHPLPYNAHYPPSYPPSYQHQHMPFSKPPSSRHGYPPVLHRCLAPDAGFLWNMNDHHSRIRSHEPACNPPLPYIKVFIKFASLQAVCKIRPRASHGHMPRQYVSVSDVIDTLYDFFRTNISQAEFQTLSAKDKARASRAYEARYRSVSAYDKPKEKMGGVKRIDFLMERHRFGGLWADAHHQPHEFDLVVA